MKVTKTPVKKNQTNQNITLNVKETIQIDKTETSVDVKKGNKKPLNTPIVKNKNKAQNNTNIQIAINDDSSCDENSEDNAQVVSSQMQKKINKQRSIMLKNMTKGSTTEQEVPVKKTSPMKSKTPIEKKAVVKQGNRKPKRKCKVVGCDGTKRPNYNFKKDPQEENYCCGTHREPGMLDLTRDLCQVEDCPTEAKFGIAGTKKGIMCGVHKGDLVNVVNAGCGIDGCTSRAHYAIEGYPKKHCKPHADIIAAQLKAVVTQTANILCASKGCSKQPSFNFEIEDKPLFCVDHADPAMIDVKNNMCAFDGCGKRANFNLPSEIHGKWCVTHADINIMIDVTHQKCQMEGCGLRASYNIKGISTPIFCSIHGKKKGMVNVVSKRCEHTDCDIIPSFNFIDCSGGAFCSTHASDLMIDVVHGKCEEEECDTQACYGDPLDKKRISCAKHKKPHHINLVNRKCEEDGCMLIPHFNFPGEIVGRRCYAHQLDDMCDVIHKLCDTLGCNTRPCFGIKGTIKGIKCKLHKKDDMVNVWYKKCFVLNCGERASYYLPTNEEQIMCMQHKVHGMIHIESKKCHYPSCKDKAIYGLPEKKPTSCYFHKLPQMINIYIEMMCDVLECENDYDFMINGIKYCGLHCPEKKIENIAKKMCQYCDMVDSPFVCKECKNIQNKTEWAIVRQIRINIKTNFIYNSSKMLQGWTSKRPDIFFELKNHCIIIEIDENQHKAYAKECEISRMCEIVGGIGGKSVIFIRFNPDKIKFKNKLVNIPLKDRLTKLYQIINFELIQNYETFNVKLIKLYFDGTSNTGTYCELTSEDITKEITI